MRWVDQVIGNMETIVSQLHTKAKALSAKQDFERHSISGSLSDVHSQHAISPSTKEEEHKARAWAEGDLQESWYMRQDDTVPSCPEPWIFDYWLSELRGHSREMNLCETAAAMFFFGLANG